MLLPMSRERAGPLLALGAAVLFGLSAPAAKLLIAVTDPWLLAGLLYLSSGIGLGLYRLTSVGGTRTANEPALTPSDMPWLAGAILAGGVVGPLLLMFGLAAGSAAQSALLLNLEGVFTALVAWVVFREHVSARIAVGMAAIAAGAMALSWQSSSPGSPGWSAALVAGACLAWAIDNNLTRKISAGDPVQIAALKGAVAGGVNTLIALGRGASWPTSGAILGASLVGLLGYGVSLALFIRALRALGTARTGAYFSTAPFLGAVGGVVILGESVTVALAVAGGLMAVGVWLHLTERHVHEHGHELLEHDHLHWHDEHHQHDHAAGQAGREPHRHWHVHAPLRHRHPHYPDLHHRHEH
jgi:drug/metabolite transporter (DMT)-like permease